MIDKAYRCEAPKKLTSKDKETKCRLLNGLELLIANAKVLKRTLMNDTWLPNTMQAMDTNMKNLHGFRHELYKGDDGQGEARRDEGEKTF